MENPRTIEEKAAAIVCDIGRIQFVRMFEKIAKLQQLILWFLLVQSYEKEKEKLLEPTRKSQKTKLKETQSKAKLLSNPPCVRKKKLAKRQRKKSTKMLSSPRHA